MKLVDDWRDCWKWLSVHCLALNALILYSWEYIPEELREELPRGAVAGVMLALGVFGRIKKQKDKKC